MSGIATVPSETSSISPRMAIAIIGGLFFVIGFVTWLNGPLISFVEVAFGLDDVSAFLVPLVFYISYFLFALPAAAILRRIGMKRGLSFALLLMAAGTALFGQFVDLRSYPGALTALFVLGGGLSLLQTAINPYVSILGGIDRAAPRIALMGICNKFAGVVAPVVFGALVLRDLGGVAARITAETDPVRRTALLVTVAHEVYVPYLIMAVLLAVAGILLARSRLPDIRADEDNLDASGRSARGLGLSSAPHLWFGIVSLFLYVGAEVMAADAIGTYGRGFHLPLDQTKFFTAMTMAAMVAGYIVGFVLVPRVFSQASYLALSAALGIVLTTLAWTTTGVSSVLCVAALGVANAMMWPTIFPLAISGLGARTATASAFLVMAICGGAFVPQAYVVIKRALDFQTTFWVVMAPIYLVIMAYGLWMRRNSARMPVTAAASVGAP